VGGEGAWIARDYERFGFSADEAGVVARVLMYPFGTRAAPSAR